MNKNITIALACLVVVILGGAFLLADKNEVKPATNFEECVALGNPVMESYPRRCRYGDITFTEGIGNELDKTDLIRLDSPRPNQSISSPVTVRGQARGNWFFEASFPVFVVDWDGKIIGQGIATAKGDWMTENFVPFEATVDFALDPQAFSNKGAIILKKDNPSGLPEHDDALEVPILFDVSTGKTPPDPVACTMEAKLCPDGSYVGRSGPKCEFTACPALPDMRGSTAGLNQRTLIGGVYITPIQVLSDSRCPADVQCIWAGEILVKIKLEEGSATTITELKFGESATIGGMKVTLASVFPEKQSTVSIQAKDYVFTFKVGD